MESLIIKAETKKELKLIKSLADKLGLKAKFSTKNSEDQWLIHEIEKARKTKVVSENDILAVLKS